MLIGSHLPPPPGINRGKYRYLPTNDAGGGVRWYLRLMRWLVNDSSSDAGDQRSPGVLAPDAFQPFLRRCRLLRQFDDVANRIIIDIGIDRLRRLAIAAVENGLSSHHGDAVVI